MKQERVSFHIIWKILVALLPILFGMPTVAMVICAYNIAMTMIETITPITKASVLVDAPIIPFNIGRYLNMVGGISDHICN